MFQTVSIASNLINNHTSVGKFVFLVLLVFICIALGGPAEEVSVGRGFESSSFCSDPVISPPPRFDVKFKKGTWGT